MQVVARLILFGDHRQHVQCIPFDQARAEQVAANCHGLLVRLIVHPDDAGLLAPDSETPT